MDINITKGWRPDFLPYDNPEGMPDGWLVTCKNLVPYDEYYAPFLSQVQYSTTATAISTDYPCYGNQEFRDSSGAYRVFLGGDKKLYMMDSTKAIADVTRTSGDDYTGGAPQWKFISYGDIVIATNFSDVPQKYTMGVSTDFEALGGSPPKGKYPLISKSRVIFANTNEGGVNYPKRVRWSAFDDTEDWTESLITGAGYADLNDGKGDITGITHRADGFVIYHQDSIALMHWSGYPNTFEPEQNKVKSIGAIENTIIPTDVGDFFIHSTGVYRFDGQQVEPLGLGIDETVVGSINISLTRQISTMHDPVRGVLYWCYPNTIQTGSDNENILCYNYRTNKFTLLDMSVNSSSIWGLLRWHAGATTLDGLDALYPDGLDSIPYSLDSSKWLANSIYLGGVSQKVYSFTGTPLAAEIETKQICTADNSVLYTTTLRPRIQGLAEGGAMGCAGYRMDEGDGMVYTTPQTLNSNGTIDTRASGRFLSWKVATTNGVTFTGIPATLWVDIQKQGEQ